MTSLQVVWLTAQLATLRDALPKVLDASGLISGGLVQFCTWPCRPRKMRPEELKLSWSGGIPNADADNGDEVIPIIVDEANEWYLIDFQRKVEPVHEHCVIVAIFIDFVPRREISQWFTLHCSDELANRMQSRLEMLGWRSEAAESAIKCFRQWDSQTTIADWDLVFGTRFTDGLTLLLKDATLPHGLPHPTSLKSLNDDKIVIRHPGKRLCRTNDNQKLDN
jgi:hypothetical protein